MSAIFLIEAREEMIEAAGFYDSKRAGLGDQFLDRVAQAVADAQSNPTRWPVLANKLRRRLLTQFPYGILYYVENENEIVIAAVMHLHRHPRYFAHRVRGLLDE